jgi:putative addiction module CopG family antidote
MDIALTGHFQNFIKAQLKGGRYRDAGEVVQAALRELEQSELKRSLAAFNAAFRTTDRHAPKGEPGTEEQAEMDRIIGAHRAARQRKQRGR